MIARKTTLTGSDLPTSLGALRAALERAIPHGRTPGKADRGAWHDLPEPVIEAWRSLAPGFRALREAHPEIERTNNIGHLGTLGTGNHFVEVCLDESDAVWVMLHSGSRGVGNWIGTRFIEMAREDMRKHHIDLPDADLAYLREGTERFDDYVLAVGWAQEFARKNREVMMASALAALRATKGIKPFTADEMAVNCHHNYVQKEWHFGKEVYVTRKGAVRAGRGELGIIPGSMGAKSFIVRGRGNADSFESCSHGAGRLYSRGEAKRRFTLADHAKATAAVECRKDADVLDETPGAYKPIEAVMAAQADLVEIVHTLRQVVCVKG
jgi:tRNA-splicing ligase RtcB